MKVTTEDMFSQNTEEEVDYKPAHVFAEQKPGSKVPQTYICDKCGRKKTIRYKTNPTPPLGGFCPRCKTGYMYSEYIIKIVKEGKITPEQIEGLKKSAMAYEAFKINREIDRRNRR